MGGPARPPYPRFSPSAVREVARLLRQGETVALGRTSRTLAKAERAISRYHGGRHVLGLNSGHAALLCALMGLEIGPGDEVITTPFTWGASISCILHVGAIPVFVDVDPVSGLMDARKIEPAITRRTKAILPVHLFGQPADMPAINRIARRHRLFVIEDGSQAHGATIHGKVVGNWSDAAGFSCMGGKLLATSEAGYLVTPHEDVFWKAAMMCQHYGRSAEPGFPEAFKPCVDSLVFTFRLSPLIAALFPSQIRRLPRQIAARQGNADRFREAMRPCEFIEFPKLKKGHLSSYHMLTTNFRPDKAGVRRETVQKALAAEGVSVFPYVPAPITRWRRLQWKDYHGPVPFWLPNLERAGTDYAAAKLPNCDFKVEYSLEMGWNYYRPDPKGMKRMAAAFLKVQDHLDELRAWEEREDRKRKDDENVVVGAARRAADAYRRR